MPVTFPGPWTFELETESRRGGLVPLRSNETGNVGSSGVVASKLVDLVDGRRNAGAGLT
jgi:hypothetical protein